MDIGLHVYLGEVSLCPMIARPTFDQLENVFRDQYVDTPKRLSNSI